MSDLISRSQLLKQIENWGGCVEALHDYIQIMPTAYSVDRVVEELEENASRYTKKYVTPYGNNGYKDTKAISIHKAIEIVKQGGVSDDVCEWIKYDYRTICPKNHDANNPYYDANNPYWRIPDNTDKLKYCPYCGKKIKVVE